MGYLENNPFWPHVVGEAYSRGILIAVVVSLLVVSSGGFVIGMDVGLSLGWIVLALAIAIVAGWKGAGLGPTIGSLWLISLWWFTFPPFVGYLTGSWADSTRYTHPRMMAYGYTSARAELLGGIEYGVEIGFLFAFVAGSIAYLIGATIPWFSTLFRTS